MAVCLEAIGEGVARGAQLIEAGDASSGPLEEIADHWYRVSSDLHPFRAREPRGGARRGAAAGVMIGVILGSR